MDKCFDAGIYSSGTDIRVRRPVPADAPVLLSEPVEWLGEYRCFVADGRVVATSPYLSFGHALAHHPGTGTQVPAPVLNLCADLVAGCELPAAVVVDIGLIEDRGWAVVEFNPAWCSNILSADPHRVLDVLTHACQRTTYHHP